MDNIEKIKRLAIIAMVSDDYLTEQLVFKGGNAIDIVYQVSGRASIGLDYSLQNDFNKHELSGTFKIINNVLSSTLCVETTRLYNSNSETGPSHSNLTTWPSLTYNFTN